MKTLEVHMMCHFLEIYAFTKIAVEPSKGIGWTCYSFAIWVTYSCDGDKKFLLEAKLISFWNVLFISIYFNFVPY